MLEFLKALLFLKGGMYIESQSLVFFAVELLDGLGGTTGTVFNIVFVW